MVEETTQSKKEPDDSFPLKRIPVELVRYKPVFESVQAIMTSLGILTAGLWFLLSSQAAVKANITQKLSMVEVTVNHTNLWWCSLEVRIENVSQRKIKVDNARVFVESIKPRPSEWSLDYDSKSRTYEWDQPVFTNNGQNYALNDFIEPGEDGYEYFEFLLPDDIQVFKETTFISQIDPAKAFWKSQQYGWLKHSIYKMTNGEPLEIPQSHD